MSHSLLWGCSQHSHRACRHTSPLALSCIQINTNQCRQQTTQLTNKHNHTHINSSYTQQAQQLDNDLLYKVGSAGWTLRPTCGTGTRWQPASLAASTAALLQAQPASCTAGHTTMPAPPMMYVVGSCPARSAAQPCPD